MNRPYLLFPIALALLAGGVGGWMLRDFKQAKLESIPEAEAWEGPKLVIPGLTMPMLFPLPPIEGATPIPPPGSEAPDAQALSAIRITSDLLYALNDATMTGEFRGNGRERMQLMMVNRTKQPVRLVIPAGQAFKGVHGGVVVARTMIFDFAAGESRLEEVATLAISSMNRVEESSFMASAERYERLDPLLRYLSARPDISIPTAQTVALAILENLPVNSVAKFTGGDEQEAQPWDTTAFRVDTADLIGALALLRNLGIPDSQVVMTIDPQTRIEAMLDPLARAQAMHYYGITPDREWSYWKSELLEGNPRTRHYALHGIGRYFPDVALKMLPSWVRETRTSNVFRNTAIIALTETRRPEALDVLKALQIELVDNTELSLAIAEAATYLETSLARTERRGQARIGFRAEAMDVPPVPSTAPAPAQGVSLLIDEVLEESPDNGEEEDGAEGSETGLELDY